MSRFARQCRAAQAVIDHAYPYDDAAEEAEEQRAEYIAEYAPAIADKLVGSEDFAWGVLVDLGDDAKRSVLQDVGRFFERYHALDDDDTQGAMVVARDLYCELNLQIEAAAMEQAETEVATEYDRRKAA